MKRISIFASVFALSFMIGVGAVVFTADTAEAGRKCLTELPCHPDDIYCTSNWCAGTCYPNGGIFYCFPDWVTEYCSGDWKWPVPCSHPI
jgi:hypothetical protein